MKKHLFFFTLFLFFTVVIHAQILKGAIFLGGDIGFSSQKTTSSNNTNLNSVNQTGFTISPVFGKAIKNNLILGAGIIISSSKGDFQDNANNRKENSFGADFFIRKYRQLGNSGFSLFLQGSLSGEYYKSTQGYNSPSVDKLKEYIIDVNLYPGVSYAVSKKLQIETGFNNLISLNYTQGKGAITGVSPVTYTNHSLNLYSSLENLSYLYVGIRVLLN